MAENRRALRVAHEIQNILTGIVDGVRDPRVGLATVTHVEMTPDLKLAKVYVSVTGSEQDKRDSLKALTHAKAYIRREMAIELRVKRIPDLQFYLDETLEQSNRIEKLLADLHNEE